MNGKELAVVCADAVNNMCFDKKGFIEQMDNEHRYLQYEFTNLCLEWLIHCGKDDYGYDGRNEVCHNVGKQIREVLGYDT